MASSVSYACYRVASGSGDERGCRKFRFGGSPANTNCALRTLRRLLHRAEEWKLIRRAPKIKLIHEQPRSLRLDEAAEANLLEGAALCKWRSKRTLERFTQILILARDTGMRNEKELYRLRVEEQDKATPATIPFWRSGIAPGSDSSATVPTVWTSNDYTAYIVRA